MNDQLTVRLSKSLAKKIDQLAKKLRLNRSDIVRLALKRFFETGESLAELQCKLESNIQKRPVAEVVRSIEKVQYSYSLGNENCHDLDEYLRDDRDRYLDSRGPGACSRQKKHECRTKVYSCRGGVYPRPESALRAVGDSIPEVRELAQV